MTKSEYGWLLALCLIILLLQLLILAYLLRRCLPSIPRPVVRFRTIELTQPTEPTNQVEEEIYDEVFVQQVAQNDGYFSEFDFQGGFSQDTGTSDPATHSTEENQ